MGTTNFQMLYFRLAAKELHHLVDGTTQDASVRDQLFEYIDHNELGLAFELLKDSLDMKNASEEVRSQMTILAEFLDHA